MAISRFQMNRQLRAYGGIMGQDGRRNYGIGSFFQKYIKDPIERSIRGVDQSVLDKESQERVDTLERLRGKGNTQPVSNFFKDLFLGKETPIGEDGKPIIKEGTTQRQGGLLSGLLTSRVGLPVAAGLLAGAFTKDKEDPLYTGQDVGLNLQDIGRLANITDPRAGQAIGLRFLPDVEARKFTPEQMAETFAANQPVDFTEKREQAQDGGIMGDQKDFEEFLQEKMKMDKDMLHDRIMKDFENYMKRKRMIENLPEAKDGGLMKMAEGGMMASAVGDESDDISMQLFGKPVKDLTPDEFKELQEEIDRLMNKFRGAKGGIASMADGGMMDMGGMEMDLRGGGFVPMGRAEKADDVPARLSKNEFVFTADAVRAAGGGDVDKGADKMYATMKKLEDRVA